MKVSKASPKTIDEYIDLCAEDVRAKLREIRSEIKSIAPVAVEKISYGIPTFAMGKNIFHFAAFKNHIGLYPGPPAIEAFAVQLEHYKTSKGAIQVPLNVELLLQLIGKLVHFNLKTLAAKRDKLQR